MILISETIAESGSLLDQVEAIQQGKEIIEQTVSKDFSDYINDMMQSVLPKIIDVGINILLILIIYFVGTKIIKYVRKFVKRAMARTSVEEGVVHFIDLLIKSVLYIILIASIISHFSSMTTTIAALVGSAGLAIGLAFQGSLSNFAGGVLLLLVHPFKVGDYIIEDANKNEGTVQAIELFYTTLVTGDNKVITIPNGTLSNCSLTNVTAQDKRRLDISVSISYNSDLRLVKELIEGILKADEGILEDQEIIVYVDNLGENAVVVGGRGWCTKEDYWATKCRVLEEIKISFDEQEIEMTVGKFNVNIINA